MDAYKIKLDTEKVVHRRTYRETDIAKNPDMS